MPRIYYLKNSAETVCEKFESYGSTLRFEQLCFTVVLFCLENLQSLKGIF